MPEAKDQADAIALHERRLQQFAIVEECHEDEAWHYTTIFKFHAAREQEAEILSNLNERLKPGFECWAIGLC